MVHECERCEIFFRTAKGEWEDELFCFTCYHELYPCPWWCPESNDYCGETGD